MNDYERAVAGALALREVNARFDRLEAGILDIRRRMFGLAVWMGIASLLIGLGVPLLLVLVV